MIRAIATAVGAALRSRFLPTVEERGVELAKDFLRKQVSVSETVLFADKNELDAFVRAVNSGLGRVNARVITREVRGWDMAGEGGDFYSVSVRPASPSVPLGARVGAASPVSSVPQSKRDPDFNHKF